jgi:TPR repeat protein
MYSNGDGVPHDMTRAVFYSKRGCVTGDAVGCKNAGLR